MRTFLVDQSSSFMSKSFTLKSDIPKRVEEEREEEDAEAHVA